MKMNQLETSSCFVEGLDNSSNQTLTVMTVRYLIVIFPIKYYVYSLDIYPRSTVTCDAQASGLENTQFMQNYEPRVLMSDVIKITVECVEC